MRTEDDLLSVVFLNRIWPFRSCGMFSGMGVVHVLHVVMSGAGGAIALCNKTSVSKRSTRHEKERTTAVIACRSTFLSPPLYWNHAPSVSENLARLSWCRVL